MSEDFEKNRSEYVTHIELQIQNLQQQIAALKANEMWTPKVGTELVADEEKARITLSFGGKNQTAVFTYEFLRSMSSIDATSNILELGFKDFIADRLRSVIQPEVERLQQGARAIASAGKW
jgi:hypothetical protein